MNAKSDPNLKSAL